MLKPTQVGGKLRISVYRLDLSGTCTSKTLFDVHLFIYVMASKTLNVNFYLRSRRFIALEDDISKKWDGIWKWR